MALYYAIGKVLVAAEELQEKAETGAVRDFLGGGRNSLDFQSGSLSAPSARSAAKLLTATREVASGDKVPFEPIGVGKPLTIRIHQAYPADLPGGGIFGKPGALLTSAVKSWQTFDAKPRALNFLKKQAVKRKPLSMPAATEEGTTLVFYSPAVAERSLTATFEIAFDDVNQALFDGIAEIFKGAAGLPIFMGSSLYLLAAGSLFRLGGQVGNRIFDSKAEFEATESINFQLPGSPITNEGFILLTRSSVDSKTLASYTVNEKGELVDKTTGAPYEGNLPYVVASLDGTADNTLEAFAPTAASASLLERFYNIREGGSSDAQMVIDALTFYNDYRFRTEVKELDDRIKAETDPAVKKALQARRDALAKNIKTKEFQL